MALSSMMNKVYTYFKPAKTQHSKYVYGVACGILILLIVGTGIFGYRWYRINQEEKAQEVFSVCMHEYDKAEKDEKLWPNAELVFRLGFEQNSSTSMAPHFLAFQAEALYRMSKPDEARGRMEKAVSLLPSSSPVYYMYATKYALMMMDSFHTGDLQKGLDLLTQLAYNEKNNTRDMALYYLGLYYWEKDELQKATTEWKLLAQVTAKQPESPWAQLALKKVNTDLYE